MHNSSIFESFSEGILNLAGKNYSIRERHWCPSPIYEGVELKHLLTAKETEGQFSYHLVRISAHKCIGLHTHETQLETHEVIHGSGFSISNGEVLSYEAGTITLFPKGTPHEVHADADGLYLFAKFIPALC